MLLLLQDNIGVFVDHNGKLTHSNEGNLSWSEAPGGIVIYAPYTLARLSRFIEVSIEVHFILKNCLVFSLAPYALVCLSCFIEASQFMLKIGHFFFCGVCLLLISTIDRS
jgi:hypothetical protein